MAIPKDILAVQRPSSTVVKQRGTRFVIVKRTSKRVGNRVIPVDIGTVGEIIDGRFVERKSESPRLSKYSPPSARPNIKAVTASLPSSCTLSATCLRGQKLMPASTMQTITT